MASKWLGLVTSSLLVASLGLAFLVYQQRNQPSAMPQLDSQLPASAPIRIPPRVVNDLREGDIIFRGKDFSWGDLGAQLSDRDKRFGHVGVIVRHDETWMIIDAIGNPLEREGRVRLRSLEDFLEPASRAAIYRPDLTSAQLHNFLFEIRRLETANTPFDRHYDLEDQTTLYCTELIWFALHSATGADQITDHTEFRGRRVIAIDDLQYAPLMSERWASGQAGRHPES